MGGIDFHVIIDTCSSDVILLGHCCDKVRQSGVGSWPTSKGDCTGEQSVLRYVSQTNQVAWYQNDMELDEGVPASHPLGERRVLGRRGMALRRRGRVLGGRGLFSYWPKCQCCEGIGRRGRGGEEGEGRGGLLGWGGGMIHLSFLYHTSTC